MRFITVNRGSSIITMVRDSRSESCS